MRALLRNMVFWLNLLVAAGLVLADLAVYISPNQAILPAYFGLVFPYFLFINFIFLILWIFRFRWQFLLPLFAILVSIPNIINSFTLQLEDGMKIENGDKVLTYNIRYFDRYNWTKDENTSKRIMDFVLQSDASIICLQEYLFEPENKKMNEFHRDLELQGYELYFQKLNPNSKTGLAIFSKYPIINRGHLSFKNSTNLAIYADLQVSGQQLRVYNLHLQSFHLNYSEYQMFDSLQFEDNERNYDNLKRLGGILGKAYRQRALQADEISAHIQQSPTAVMVCGDFNDTPVSYTYKRIRTGLEDSFKQGGRGFSTTYLDRRLPAFRIDYILYSPELMVGEYEVGKMRFSDHFPVWASFTINAKGLSD
jgi:endonuclease/exonuclease/phosphatase family metal-dependent hydrolase